MDLACRDLGVTLKSHSAAHYVRGLSDGLTDTNKYLGRMEERDRATYAQVLMSDIDDEMMRQQSVRPVVGGNALPLQLKKQRGRYRRVCGRPAKVCEYPNKTLQHKVI